VTRRKRHDPVPSPPLQISVKIRIPRPVAWMMAGAALGNLDKVESIGRMLMLILHQGA
jgi:hypothetical protein